MPPVGVVLRGSWAPWALPVVAIFIAVYAADSPPVDDRYWVSATAAGVLLMIFVAPACAVCAAWDGFRSRRLERAVGIPVRSPIRLMLNVCWPVGLLGLAALGLSLWLYLPPGGTPGGPEPRIVGVFILLLAAHTAVGYVVGRLLPVVMAVPLVAIGSYLLGAMPPAMEPVWLRHIVGTGLDTCCWLDEVPDPAALWAPVLFYGAALVAVVGFALLRPAWRIVAVLPLAVSGVVAVRLVAPMDWTPTQPRPMADASCYDAEPELCIWPEQHRVADDVRVWAAEPLERLDAAGLEYPPELDPLSFDVTGLDPDRVRATVAAHLMPSVVCENGVTDVFFDTEDRVAGWLHLTVGVSDAGVESVIPVDALRQSRAVHEHMAPPEQLNWYRSELDVLSACGFADPAQAADQAAVNTPERDE
ncbi:DUF7224 domain-containing protein [Phytoactinopolyspora limicola]|uniref:DUF7224 domain-containing protein n=1 Tax=Phytoactinopolyspora limicola TaxID=2715536 RepID=UPI00140BEDE9|nr:hypothetical protein [Phytoactinopolyspora limicola]